LRCVTNRAGACVLLRSIKWGLYITPQHQVEAVNNETNAEDVDCGIIAPTYPCGQGRAYTRARRGRPHAPAAPDGGRRYDAQGCAAVCRKAGRAAGRR
jgi:hypothetical protein